MATNATASRVRSGELLLRWSTLLYLAIMVALPIVALAFQAAAPGLGPFARVVTDPYAWHALKLTFLTALMMVAVSAVTGTATAWVLVRYDFPGRRIVNALIDLPFAVPTVVTGVMLVVAVRSGKHDRRRAGKVRLASHLPAAGHRASLTVCLLPLCDPQRPTGLDGAGPGRGRSIRNPGRKCLDNLSQSHASGPGAVDPDRLGTLV